MNAFDETWDVVSAFQGWCTREQARSLWDAASRLGDKPQVLEIGSHQGKSTVVLARAVQGKGGTVHAVDPFVEGRLFGGKKTRESFEDNLAQGGVSDVVDLHAEYSGALRPTWTEPFDLLYVDGKHDYWTVVDDLKWGVHLPPGGELLVHDAFSSIGVTLGLLRSILLSSEWSFVSRETSLALFRKTPPTRRDRVRFLKQLPWWARNVVIKVLLRLRLTPVARALGHDHEHDPY
jgi:hypothetical protein